MAGESFLSMDKPVFRGAAVLALASFLLLPGALPAADRTLEFTGTVDVPANYEIGRSRHRFTLENDSVLSFSFVSIDVPYSFGFKLCVPLEECPGTDDVSICLFSSPYQYTLGDVVGAIPVQKGLLELEIWAINDLAASFPYTLNVIVHEPDPVQGDTEPNGHYGCSVNEGHQNIGAIRDGDRIYSRIGFHGCEADLCDHLRFTPASTGYFQFARSSLLTSQPFCKPHVTVEWKDPTRPTLRVLADWNPASEILSPSVLLEAGKTYSMIMDYNGYVWDGWERCHDSFEFAVYRGPVNLSSILSLDVAENTVCGVSESLGAVLQNPDTEPQKAWLTVAVDGPSGREVFTSSRLFTIPAGGQLEAKIPWAIPGEAAARIFTGAYKVTFTLQPTRGGFDSKKTKMNIICGLPSFMPSLQLLQDFMGLGAAP